MRQLNLLIKNCSECPYFLFTDANDHMYPLCYFREKTPFALIGLSGGNWQEGIDDRCELPEYFDVDIPAPKDEDIPFHTFSNRLLECHSLPENWLQEMNDMEREKFNQEEDERINQILREQGFDIPSSHGVEFDEFEDGRG